MLPEQEGYDPDKYHELQQIYNPIVNSRITVF